MAAHTFIPLSPAASAHHTPISMMEKVREEARTPSTKSTLRPQSLNQSQPQPHTPTLLGRLAGVGLRLSEDAPHTGEVT